MPHPDGFEQESQYLGDEMLERDREFANSRGPEYELRAPQKPHELAPKSNTPDAVTKEVGDMFEMGWDF